MAKEKVFIVLSHKHSLKRGTKDHWEVSETVEFVNQLRNRHHTMSTAIADYLNEKMLTGSRSGMTDYKQFEGYVRKKYEKELSQLDSMYKADRPEKATEPELYTDKFGTVRLKTVFDS